MIEIPESKIIGKGKRKFHLTLKSGGFIFIHVVGILGLFAVGFSPIAFFVSVFNYIHRMFAVTANAHRLFSHRSWKYIRYPRTMMFLAAFHFSMAAQKGAIWWVSHHRDHHRHSDTLEDPHSAFIYGLWWSHVGWVLCEEFEEFGDANIEDLKKYPELMWFEKDNNHMWGPILLGVLCTALGAVLWDHQVPWGLQWLLGATFSLDLHGLHYYFGTTFHTGPIQMLVWGLFTSTTVLYHGTFAINSFAHKIGRRRFETGEHSKNSLILAILTLGEGWHNNHHHDMHREAQALTPFELCFDWTHWGIRFQEIIGLVEITKETAVSKRDAKRTEVLP